MSSDGVIPKFSKEILERYRQLLEEDSVTPEHVARLPSPKIKFNQIKQMSDGTSYEMTTRGWRRL